MKPSTVLFAVFATFATASVLPAQDDTAQIIQDTLRIEDRAVIKTGGDFISGLLEQIDKFPGVKEIKQTFLCMRHDKHWKADYSKRGDGVVTFTDVPSKCCTTAQSGWEKYSKDWSKLVTPVFNTPCNGGSLTRMKPSHIEKLRKMIGDGHR